ncbi:MAG: long-chain fatty acid--CoA ligase [Bacteroidales bacterium]
MEIHRLFDLLPYYSATHPPKNDVLAGKENGKWYTYSIHDYREAADNISYGLLNIGIKPGDAIATVLNNRPEWNLLDMGIMQIGAIHVPIYPTISDADFQYILNHAEVKAIFVAGEDLYKKIERVKPQDCCLDNVFSIRPQEGIKSLDDLMQKGKNKPRTAEVEGIKAGITTSDLATLIYTSGTTGFPKGVMLSHRNIISNIKGVYNIPKMGAESRCVSFLPLSHVYERLINYTYQYLGISIYYVESMATITDNIKEVSPNMICAVPRFLEKVYDKILAAGRKLSGVKKSIFFWALHLAEQFETDRKNGAWYHIKLAVADRLVYSKWRAALGGKLSLIVSGGAALQPRLARVFWAAGIEVYEGYGLTETSPVIAVSTREKGGVTFGCVGPVIQDVIVKIADDGEIICKGPNVMMGYYKDPGLTNEVIDGDGWFHSGDIGVFEPNGHLRLSGRKKEIFKTSMGKYIAPQLIENKMKESSFIDNIMVVGENQKYAAALIVPNFEYLKAWCKIKEIPYTTDGEMAKSPIIRKRYIKEVDELNQSLGATEQIRKFELMTCDWTIAGEELTPSLKLRRANIFNKYKILIDSLFE